mmetsp:Transcript_2693/g.4560  ORF Transcript_2693/g.4560 Transcript_2693/m.4560 type:complete len:127 (-) Transcript_2693:356-736(-)
MASLHLFLSPVTAAAVLGRVVEARADAVAFISFLCTRKVRRMTGASALWPVRNALRDFLVFSNAATWRLMRELQQLLQQSAAVVAVSNMRSDHYERGGGSGDDDDGGQDGCQDGDGGEHQKKKTKI